MQAINDNHLFDVFSLLLKKKNFTLIVIITMISTSISLTVALSLPNQYRAEALLEPVFGDTENDLMALARQFGGLSSISGLNLSPTGVNKSDLVIEILKSKSFVVKFIRKFELEVPLMGARGWDNNSGNWIIDRSLYDPELKTWIRKASPPFKPQPSTIELYEAFMNNSLSIDINKQTNLITLRITSPSPVAAQRWTTLIVSELNNEIRTREVEEAEKSIEYLKAQINNTGLTDMKTIFYNLIEQKTRIILLATTRPEYALKTIDPAIVPLEHYHPNRPLIVLVATLLGIALSITFILLRNLVNNTHTKAVHTTQYSQFD